MGWTQLIQDEIDKRKVSEIIAFISNSQQQNYRTSDLMYGNIGISIFHSYLFLLTSNQVALKKSVELVQETLDALTEAPIKDLGMGKGISGILWGINHLFENGIIEGNISDFVDDNFLQNLNSQSADAISLGEYDYLLGGTGSLLFAVDVKKRNYVNALLSKLISLSARVENDSPIWYQSPSLNVSQDKVINLGLAHGIPGILTILSSSVSLADNPHDISILISKCFDWLKANQLNPSIDGCYFPFSKSESNEAFPSSLRWCYGDLGVSISLILIGRRIGNQMIEGYGLEIATHCASRNIDKSGISDAHICHGTAGIAHIYNRLFNYTGKRLFKEASVYWVLETLNRFNPQLQSGFQAWKGKFGWVEYDGLLEGSAGIGLTLISAISDIEPKWDRCILLS